MCCSHVFVFYSSFIPIHLNSLLTLQVQYLQNPSFGASTSVTPVFVELLLP
ncbi:hypothetical protein CROQUDRAFT_525815 [Cronartium quercuum f. sp. fusiforme G11]|uniref:Uncharacterized protein n=1 Tax=Cronartium quercuum f. sp. fusiforme G11 TaxID=708437 RepID=A0A9P6NLT7_9BASI|nr:hypothetical protein CROQUDRAFT_525815 [Cronartium quercuum f. sp. fusiforme G11]